MVPITDYIVLADATLEGITSQVKSAIANGWTVMGGLTFGDSSVPYHRELRYYQTMVKAPNTLAQISSQLSAISSKVTSIDDKTPDPNA